MNKTAQNHSQRQNPRFRTGYDRVIGVDVSKTNSTSTTPPWRCCGAIPGSGW